MTPDVQAAIEHCESAIASSSLPHAEKVLTLCRYLRTLADPDVVPLEQPVTSDWLKELGSPDGATFELNEGTLEIRCKFDGGGVRWTRIEIENNADWYGCSHAIDLPNPQTRSQVLALLAALGVKGGTT